MSFYVYCLARGPEEVEGLAGVAGAGVSATECEGLTAVVSEFDGARVAPSPENLKAHNRVLAHVLARTTPLPFRFGTLADAARLAAYVSQNRGALDATLERVAGCVEMSVKVLCDEEGGARASDASAPSESSELLKSSESSKSVGSASSGASGSVGGAGAAFLAAKRAALAGGERRRARAEEVGGWVAARLAPVSRSTRARLSPEERIVLRASHLVERARLSEYREAVRLLVDESLAGRKILASGPWPPYSFCDLRP